MPAGCQCVPQALGQPWEGRQSQRPAVVQAALHVPRKRLERARTGTSQAAPRGGRTPVSPLVTGPPQGRGHGHADGRPGLGATCGGPPQAALPTEGVGGQSEGWAGRSRGGPQQGRQAAVVGARPRAEGLRERQGDQTRGDRQEEPLRRCQPRGGGCRLTRGPRPVRAGRRPGRAVPARWARRARPPQSRSTAPFEGRHGRQVAGWPTVGALGAIGWAIASAARRQCKPGSPPVDWRGRP